MEGYINADIHNHTTGSVNIPKIPETEWILSAAVSGKEYIRGENGIGKLVTELEEYEER